MGFLGENKYERKLTDLLLRLFGDNCVRCMNLGSEEGLLTQIRNDLRERMDNRFENLRKEIDDLKKEIEELKPKRRVRVKKVKRATKK